MSGASQDDNSIMNNTKTQFDFKAHNDNSIKHGSPKSRQPVTTMNVLTAKSTKVPISFVKDNALQGYTPRKDDYIDFIPMATPTIPKLKPIQPDGTYPMPTRWHQ